MAVLVSFFISIILLIHLVISDRLKYTYMIREAYITGESVERPPLTTNTAMNAFAFAEIYTCDLNLSLKWAEVGRSQSFGRVYECRALKLV